MPQLTFNPGLTSTGFRTTRPCIDFLSRRVYMYLMPGFAHETKNLVYHFSFNLLLQLLPKQ